MSRPLVKTFIYSHLLNKISVPLEWISQQELSVTPQSWSPDTTSESDLQNSGQSSPRNQSSVTTEIFNPLLSPIQSKYVLY